MLLQYLFSLIKKFLNHYFQRWTMTNFFSWSISILSNIHGFGHCWKIIPIRTRERTREQIGLKFQTLYFDRAFYKY
jgi:hypothetical protein